MIEIEALEKELPVAKDFFIDDFKNLNPFLSVIKEEPFVATSELDTFDLCASITDAQFAAYNDAYSVAAFAMEQIVAKAQDEIDRAVIASSDYLGIVIGCNEVDLTLKVDAKILSGDLVQLTREDGGIVEDDLTVEVIDSACGIVAVNRPVDYLAVPGSSIHLKTNNTLDGLAAIFSKQKKFSQDFGGKVLSKFIYVEGGELSLESLCSYLGFKDGKRQEDSPDFLYCSVDVFDKLKGVLRREAKEKLLGYCYVYEWNGITIAANKFMHSGTMYALCTDCFVLQQRGPEFIKYDDMMGGTFLVWDSFGVQKKVKMSYQFNISCTDLRRQMFIHGINEIYREREKDSNIECNC